MKYLCLIYTEESRMESLPPAEAEALSRGCLATREALLRTGKCLASAKLQSVRTATTLRFRDGRAVAVDGPFAETKEQLGGFVLLEAADLDEAIATVSALPGAHQGCMEIRPLDIEFIEFGRAPGPASSAAPRAGARPPA